MSATVERTPDEQLLFQSGFVETKHDYYHLNASYRWDTDLRHLWHLPELSSAFSIAWVQDAFSKLPLAMHVMFRHRINVGQTFTIRSLNNGFLLEPDSIEATFHKEWSEAATALEELVYLRRNWVFHFVEPGDVQPADVRWKEEERPELEAVLNLLGSEREMVALIENALMPKSLPAPGDATAEEDCHDG